MGQTFAHGVGQRYQSPLTGRISCDALTVLMSLYTVSTLWLLSLPLVTQS